MSAEIAKPVTIPYESLINPEVSLLKEIEEAFGYAGIGLLLVTGVPGFEEARLNLLPLGSKLANIGNERLEKIVDAKSNYSVGWSHGKEMLRKGLYDTFKGSFYANPQYDSPTDDAELIKNQPENYAPNIWPSEDVPELEGAFKALGQLVVKVGEQVARRCDEYIKSQLPTYESGTLEEVIKTSRVAKGRLLHYFPIPEEGERSRDSWCAWHNDHSCLTGLCSAYYVDTSSETPYSEVVCPDPDAGLYARTRTGKEVKVGIPRNALAFQIGESSQVLSGGSLRATPHSVQALKYPDSKVYGRDTFAIFMQPNQDKLMNPPQGVAPESVAVGQWKPGMTYGEFSHETITNYYTE